jgi:hypothetical protein
MLYLTTSGEIAAERLVAAAQVDSEPPMVALLLAAQHYASEDDFDALCAADGIGFIPCWMWDCVECSVRNEIINKD